MGCLVDCLNLISLADTTHPVIANSVDPDQLASAASIVVCLCFLFASLVDYIL